LTGGKEDVAHIWLKGGGGRESGNSFAEVAAMKIEEVETEGGTEERQKENRRMKIKNWPPSKACHEKNGRKLPEGRES